MEQEPDSKQGTMWAIFIIVLILIGGGGYLIWYQYIKEKPVTTNAPVATNVNVNVNANANTNSATADWKTYTNTTYGFTLTLTNNWQKYRYQIVRDNNGAESTIYFSLPTTETAYKDATDQAPAGYAPVFHVNVYPVATYTATTLGNDTLLQKNTKYAFTWGLESSIPADVSVEAKADVANIASSFKLMQ